MDGRPTWTDCDEAGDYVVPNVSSPRHLVSRPENIDETVPHNPGLTLTHFKTMSNLAKLFCTESRPRYQVGVYRTIGPLACLP